MTKLPHLDNLLVRITPEDIPEEKLTHVDATEDYQLKRRHVAIGKEISLLLHAHIITVLKEHQDTLVWEGEVPTQVDRHIAQAQCGPFLPSLMLETSNFDC